MDDDELELLKKEKVERRCDQVEINAMNDDEEYAMEELQNTRNGTQSAIADVLYDLQETKEMMQAFLHQFRNFSFRSASFGCILHTILVQSTE